MGEFLKTWYGIALFIAFDAVAAIAVIAITYRWFFKRLLDIVASLVCMLVLSPVWLFVLVRGRLFQKRTGAMKSLISREFFVGKKAKTIVLHTFCFTDDEGDEAGSYGRMLKKTRFYKLPCIFDVFCGRLSFIGVKRLSLADAALVSESDEGRYSVRAGLINPMVLSGSGEADYKEMFASDLSYVKKLGLFGDMKIFFGWLVKRIRGEKSGWPGITAEKTYAEVLLEEGEITQEDFAAVMENAAAEEAELRKKYEPEDPETPEGGAAEADEGEGNADETER